MEKMSSLQYRPFSLNEMVGQKGIRSEIKNRSLTKEFPQVMILEGTTGLGKTTLASIVAATLTCRTPKQETDEHGAQFMSPCGECPSCIDIKNETFSRDIKVYDASGMGKDDVLQLRNQVDVMPFHDDVKVVIIDEAQELSKAGKGATLKLLEQTRNDVYFILCTMESSSLLDAVKGRGERYKFKSIGRDEVAERLYNVLKYKGLDETVPESFISEGLFVIAEYARGDMRSALQTFDRCIHGKFYTEAQIVDEFEFISEEKTAEILQSLLKKDKAFFEQIAKYDTKEFFFISWKILQDTYKYKITRKTDKEWKGKYLTTFVKYDTLEAVLNIYQKTYTAYFHQSYFLIEVAKYFNTVEPKPTAAPVRPVRKVAQ